MSFRSERYAYTFAGPEHSSALLKIYESGEFEGNISVLYTRRPDPVQSLKLEGEGAVIPIVVDRKEDLVCAMGACVVRKVYLNGEIKRAGYLTGLKSLPEYRWRIPNGAKVYRLLYEETKDLVDFYYTTILSDNTAVQRMLEKKRKNMPEYRCHGEYTVYCLKTGGGQWARKNGGYRLGPSSLAEIAAYFAKSAPEFNFSPGGTDWAGLKDEDCYVLRDTSGEIAAACGLWNQQTYKQYLITGYKGIYRCLNKLPLKLFGYPNLPPVNEAVNYAAVTMLAVRNNDPELAEFFIKKVAAEAVSYDFLMLGLFENHPLTASLAKLRSIKYASKLYTVHWNEVSSPLDDRPVHLEVGLL